MLIKIKTDYKKPDPCINPKVVKALMIIGFLYALMWLSFGPELERFDGTNFGVFFGQE